MQQLHLESQSTEVAESRTLQNTKFVRRHRLERVLFFAAKPRDEDAFDELRAEAVAERDLVILPHVWEHYDNITHQTLEMCRAAALERRMTHLLKALLHSTFHACPQPRRTA